MSESDITRRRALALGGAAAGAVLGLGISSCSSPHRGLHGPGPDKVPAPAPGAELCVLTPSVTEGSHHLPGAPFREDITEGRKGVPLTVRLTVRDQPHACALLEDADVEIWHCDAQGSYSGHPGGTAHAESRDAGGANSRTYLRGCRTTGADGVAEFRTIFPGWYPPRAPHIHVEVHTGGHRTGSTYKGGRVSWTGQLFFDDQYADEVYARAPYTGHTGARTRLAQDPVYGGSGARDGLMDVTGDVDRGFVATLTVGIDPTREHTGAGPGGGEGPPSPSAAPSGMPKAPTTSPVPDDTGRSTPLPPPDSAASASRMPTPP